MTACSAPARRPDARVGRVQLLAHSAALRTALRRALAPAGGTLSPAQPADASDGTAPVGACRPDAVVLDTSLPGLNGLGLLRQIAESDPGVRVIVVAPDTSEGRSLRAEAMKAGAAGFVLRPETDQPLLMRPAAEEIVGLIEPGAARPRPAARPGARPDGAGMRARVEPLPRPAERARATPQRARAPLEPRRPDPPAAPAAEPKAATPPARASRKQLPAPQLVVVASSTGGPQALIDVFRGIGPAGLPVPVLVVQHMPAAFTPILAEHLSRATAWSAREAASDEPLAAGEIRIAPGGHHMVITGAGSERRIRLTSTPPVNFCRPSADVLFTSAAEAYGRAVLAVILTGMGNDGTEGAKVIAAAGGAVLAQDKATSVVWGMPGAAVNAGIVDKVVPLDAMAQAMQSAMKGVL